MSGREQRLLDAFGALAEILAGDYEIHSFLELVLSEIADMVDVTTGGVLLESPTGELKLAAALTEEMEVLERAELENAEGPCYEAYRTGELVLALDLRDPSVQHRWPTVFHHMRSMGLVSVYAFPLRLRGDVIGALNVYRCTDDRLREDEIRLARAFADVAAVSIFQERRVTTAERRAEQLQHALDSRIVIEQAKGVLSVELGVSTTEAFDILRRQARSQSRKVRDLATEVVGNGMDALRITT